MSTALPEHEKQPVLPNENRIITPKLPTSGSLAVERTGPVVIHVSASAYLRTMWSLLWTAFRHPLTTTYIDVSTGKVIPRRKK